MNINIDSSNMTTNSTSKQILQLMQHHGCFQVGAIKVVLVVVIRLAATVTTTKIKIKAATKTNHNTRCWLVAK